jgi:hypothetical protein
MKPDINEGLLLNSRLLCQDKPDQYPGYYRRYHLIKICFFTPDESQHIIYQTFKHGNRKN